MEECLNKQEDIKIEEIATKERILNSAKKLMPQYGFKGTTTRMIAKDAGVNEVTLFRQFDSKEGIIVAIANQLADYDNKRLEKILKDNDKSLKEMLYDFGMELYKGLNENRGVLIISFIEAENRKELAAALGKIIQSAVLQLNSRLEELFKREIIRECDFLATSQMFVQTMWSTFMVQNRLASKEFYPVDIERLCKNTVDVLLNGISKINITD